MPRSEAIAILHRHGLVGRYYGPGYNSWRAVQDFMCDHPRARGLRGGSEAMRVYEACRVYQSERSRSKNYALRSPD